LLTNLRNGQCLIDEAIASNVTVFASVVVMADRRLH